MQIQLNLHANSIEFTLYPKLHLIFNCDFDRFRKECTEFRPAHMVERGMYFAANDEIFGAFFPKAVKIEIKNCQIG